VDVELGRRWLSEFRDLRPLMIGDMYPLVPHSLSEGAWLVSQYDRPDLGKGMIVGFRRRWCESSSAHVRPRGLEPQAMYQLTYASGQPAQERRGTDLLAGVLMHVADAPGHEVIRYTRLDRE